MTQGIRLFATQKPNRIRFRAMMESGLLVDEEADIVQTQVIAHKARASIRNRNTVPLYYQTEEDRTPVWKENLLVETGLSPPPGMDSRYNLEDSTEPARRHQVGRGRSRPGQSAQVSQCCDHGQRGRRNRLCRVRLAGWANDTARHTR